MGWKETLATIAPTIATALGGPLAGTAVQVAAKALGVTPDQKTLENLVTSGNPEILLKLKEAEQSFQLELKKLEVSLEELEVKDRDSAREREMAIKDKTPQILAYSYTIGFFVVLAAQFYLVIAGIPLAPGALRMLDATTGILFAMMLGSKEYYFGSSAGSKRKSEQLDKLLNK